MAKAEDKYSDYVFEEEYHGHKCSMNFDINDFHSRKKLKSLDNLDEFLSYYRQSGLEAPEPFPSDRMIPTEIPANKALCQNCEHSSFRALPLSNRVYHLVDRKTEGSTCPLEKGFIKGTAFKLKTVPADKLVCMNPDCYYYLRPIEVTADDYTTPEFHDILYRGSPAIVEVTRAKYKCPFCNGRLPVQLIPNVEIAPRYQLTARLLKEIYNYSISAAGGISLLSNKELAEGYGINRKKLAEYLKGERAELINNYLAAQARKLEEKHQSQFFRYDNPSRYAVSKMTENQCTCFAMFYCKAAVRDIRAESDDAELILKAAFDFRYVQTAEKWLTGHFSEGELPLSEDLLTIFSHYYSATEHFELAHTYFFYIVRFILLYGQMLQKAPDLRKFILTKKLADQLSSGDFFEPNHAVSLAKDIYLFAHYSGQFSLAEAAKVLIDYIDSNLDPHGSAADNKCFYDIRETWIFDEIDDLQEALTENLSKLPDISDDEESYEEYYQTNPDLVLQRILYFNETAVSQALGQFPSNFLFEEDGAIRKDIDFSDGVPVAKLAELVREKGLFAAE